VFVDDEMDTRIGVVGRFIVWRWWWSLIESGAIVMGARTKGKDG
jgi:hypothetical protein